MSESLLEFCKMAKSRYEKVHEGLWSINEPHYFNDEIEVYRQLINHYRIGLEKNYIKNYETIESALDRGLDLAIDNLELAIILKNMNLTRGARYVECHFFTKTATLLVYEILKSSGSYMGNNIREIYVQLRNQAYIEVLNVETSKLSELKNKHLRYLGEVRHNSIGHKTRGQRDYILSIEPNRTYNIVRDVHLICKHITTNHVDLIIQLCMDEGIDIDYTFGEVQSF